VKISLSKTIFLAAALSASCVGLTTTAMAGDQDRLYRVTIQDATLGQPLSPPVIATHTTAFQLFELGPTPSVGDAGYNLYLGLAAVAETGFPFRLLDEILAAGGVWEAMALPPVLHPGESNSTTISASGNAKYLSIASMLGRTNDGFWALRGVELPRGIGDTVRYFANGYDAGSEANAESTTTVGGADGDDGDSGFGINDGSGEGYIFVHAGIQGVGGPGGLDPAVYDWRNPVVEVTIERVQ